MSETSDEARARRRWITLAEFVAVAGLLIGATTLYLNWADRREERATKSYETANADKSKSIVTLTGTVEDDAIRLADPSRAFSGATVRFPTALGVSAKDAMPGPQIRSDWIAAPILTMTDKGADERQGRLPVLITLTWWDGDTKREDSALYDLLWRTEGRLLRGRKLVLTGLALNARTGSAEALDSAWRRQRPIG